MPENTSDSASISMRSSSRQAFMHAPMAEGLATLRITTYLRRLLEKYEHSEFIRYVVAPSPSTLSNLFQCSESELQAALQELKRQGYEYEIAPKTNAETSPITLWDPRNRHPKHPSDTVTPWQAFYQAVWNPHYYPIAT